MNRTIADSNAAAAAAARLDGTSVEIVVEHVTRVRAAVAAGRLILTASAAGTEAARSKAAHTGGADTTAARSDPAQAVISGSLLTLVRSALERGTPRAHAGLSVTGNAEIAAGYRSLFRLATPDVEEQLAQLLGDAPARAIGNFLASGVTYLQRTRRTLEQNVAEYLQEESRDLVSRTEAEEFLRGVDHVRETADRVAARLQQLEQRLKGTA